MEEIIKRIVAADKQARHALRDKKQESRNVQNLIQKQKEEIKQKYQEESKACIAAQKAQMDEELSAQQQAEQKNYEEAVADLQKTYDDHAQEWITAIYDRCLGN